MYSVSTGNSTNKVVILRTKGGSRFFSSWVQHVYLLLVRVLSPRVSVRSCGILHDIEVTRQ